MALSKADRQKRAKYVQKTLQALYPDPKPPLDHDDAFTLLVAVMLSAQTTDAMVNQVTPSLFKLAHTPEKMAKLSSDEILTHILRCNYSPTKSRNIQKLSQSIVENFGGKVPKTFEELESLPGIGHKTASVVMSQMFGLPAFPIDTHIHRLAIRWKLSAGKNVEQTEADLKELFPESTWHDVHLQIIFYGREHCSARGCDGKTCKICHHLNVKN
jgi:endonuclease-3